MEMWKKFSRSLGIDYLFKTYHPTLNSTLGTWFGRMKEIYKYIFIEGDLWFKFKSIRRICKLEFFNKYPNLQIYFNPITYSITHKNKRPLLKTDKFDGFIIGYNSCRPKSLGEVYLSSPICRR